VKERKCARARARVCVCICEKASQIVRIISFLCVRLVVDVIEFHCEFDSDLFYSMYKRLVKKKCAIIVL